jgi:hypothetical protein
LFREEKGASGGQRAIALCNPFVKFLEKADFSWCFLSSRDEGQIP